MKLVLVRLGVLPVIYCILLQLVQMTPGLDCNVQILIKQLPMLLMSSRVLTLQWMDGASPASLLKAAVVGRPAPPPEPYRTSKAAEAGAAGAKMGIFYAPSVAASPEASANAASALKTAPGHSDTAAAGVAARAQLLQLVEQGLECTLCQLLESGVMHADPHPGNVLMLPDGRLCYLDFGLLVEVPAQASQASGWKEVLI
jgi:hypothetical protein